MICSLEAGPTVLTIPSLDPAGGLLCGESFVVSGRVAPQWSGQEIVIVEIACLLHKQMTSSSRDLFRQQQLVSAVVDGIFGIAGYVTCLL